MVKVLVVAPHFELATHEWFPWLTIYLKNQLEAKGVEPVILAEDDAVKEKVYEALKDPEVKALVGVGHGNENVFTGQNYDYIFVTCNYPPELIKGKNFAPVSCLVGAGLLPDMEVKGLGAGLGEIIEYVFYAQVGVDPLHDWILALFTKAEFSYILSLAEGKTHIEAHAIMLKEYYKNADMIRNDDPEIAMTLILDADNRRAFGDPNWRLVEAPTPPPEEKYECPWCGFKTGDAEEMKLHIMNVHVYPQLKPCFIPRFIRRLIGCPLPS